MNLLSADVKVTEMSLAELADLAQRRSEAAFQEYTRQQHQGNLDAARRSWQEYSEADDLCEMISRVSAQVSGS